MLFHYIFNERKIILHLRLLVDDVHQADNVAIAFFVVGFLGELQKLELFLTDLLGLQPTDHGIGCSLALIWHGSFFSRGEK